MAKKLYIMRGLPGSGKSTLARTLTLPELIVSADDYFTAGNNYIFDRRRIGQAHAWCEGRIESLLAVFGTYFPDDQNISVVVDNTHTRRWEYAKYERLAEKYGFEVLIKFPQTPWAWDPEECARRNKHKVPIEIIHRMLNRFEARP